MNENYGLDYDIIKDESIKKQCKEKMALGQKKYGRFDPLNETRNLHDEIIEEYIDAINYSLMMIEQMKALRAKAVQIKNDLKKGIV